MSSLLLASVLDFTNWFHAEQLNFVALVFKFLLILFPTHQHYCLYVRVYLPVCLLTYIGSVVVVGGCSFCGCRRRKVSVATCLFYNPRMKHQVNILFVEKPLPKRSFTLRHIFLKLLQKKRKTFKKFKFKTRTRWKQLHTYDDLCMMFDGRRQTLNSKSCNLTDFIKTYKLR